MLNLHRVYDSFSRKILPLGDKQMFIKEKKKEKTKTLINFKLFYYIVRITISHHCNGFLSHIIYYYNIILLILLIYYNLYIIFDIFIKGLSMKKKNIEIINII